VRLLAGLGPALLLLLAWAADAGAAPPLDAGRRALARGELHEALAHFRTASATAPASATVHANRGHVAELMGEFDEALEAYQTAARLRPEPRMHHRVGALAERIGRDDLAVEALTTSLASPLLDRVRGALRDGVSAWADCFARAQAWLLCTAASLRVTVAEFLRYPGAAAEHLLQILVETGQREAALALAARQGWLRDGADYCAKAPPHTSSDTGAFLAMLVHPARADCALETAMSLTESGLTRLARRLLLDRAANSTRLDVREAATAFLRRRLPAHDVAKRAESLNVTAYRLQSRHKMTTDAVAVFQRAIAADPSFSWPYANIGWVYMQGGADEQALPWLRRAVAVNPDHWRAHFNLGVVADRLGRWDEALAAYQRAVDLDPDDADGHAELGWLCLKLDRVPDALRELATAVRLNPELIRERQFLDRNLGAGAGVRARHRASA
jgi:tetratricopeptide (TPR) repeat protein